MDILRNNAFFFFAIPGSYFDSLTKELKSVEEENTKIDLEIDRLMDTFATGKIQASTRHLWVYDIPEITGIKAVPVG